MVLSSLVLPLRPHCHSLLPYPSPPPLPSKRAGEENWRHKGQRSQIEIRTIYWKQRWDKKPNNNSSSTDEGIRNKLFKWCPSLRLPVPLPFSHNRQFLTSATIHQLEREPFSLEESFSPASDVRFIWITSLSWPCSLPTTAKINPILTGTRTLLCHVSFSFCLPTSQSERRHYWYWS